MIPVVPGTRVQDSDSDNAMPVQNRQVCPRSSCRSPSRGWKAVVLRSDGLSAVLDDAPCFARGGEAADGVGRRRADDALAVVQKTEDGAFAYVTDGNDHWARLEGDAVADLVVGSGITSISGELTQMGIAPTIVLAGAPTEADAPDYQIMRLDLKHDIAAPPAPCQVVSVRGFYDGLKVRAFHSEPQGQGLLINADHTTLALQVGHLYDIVGAIELFEPWDDDASGAPRRVKTTDDDFLDNIYLMLIDGDEEIVTSITDLNAAKRGGQRYNVLGQHVGSDYRGIVIENGKKRVIK